MCDANHVFAFVLCSHRKFITLRVLDREEYEKECSFFLVLGDPVWLRRGVKGVRVKPDQLLRRFRLLSLCLSTLTLLSPRTLAPGHFALPPSKLGHCTFFALFSFLFHFGRTPSHSQGPPGSKMCSQEGPGAPGQGTFSITSPQKHFKSAALPGCSCTFI